MGREPDDGATRPTDVTETLVAPGGIVSDAFLAAPATRMVWSADRAVTELYSLHYRALVHLAALLVRDTQTAEEVVQDAFRGHARRLAAAGTPRPGAGVPAAGGGEPVPVGAAAPTVVDKNLQKAPPDMPSAEHGAMVLLERHAVRVAALRDLPERQREAIVLRSYADLSEAEIAATMGISRGAVKSHTAAASARCAQPWSRNNDQTRLRRHAAARTRLRRVPAACPAYRGDQVEPGQDGLERIRARVRSGRPTPGRSAGRPGRMAVSCPTCAGAGTPGATVRAHGSGGRGAALGMPGLSRGTGG